MDLFKLIFNQGTEDEETIILHHHYDFDPDAHYPEKRVVAQRMLGGVNVQESEPIYGGREIKMQFVGWTKAEIDALNAHYTSTGETVVYHDDRFAPADQWPVVIKTFAHRPHNWQDATPLYRGELTLLTLGKLHGGVVLP